VRPQGAAANVPTAIGIIGVTFPPGKAKNYAFSCYSAGAPLGSVFGNILSGFVAEYADWKWVFAVTAIMAGLISLAGFFVIPPPPPSSGPPTPSPNGASTGSVTASAATVDWIGATLVTVGLLALMFALTEGNVVGWSTPWIPALIVVSIVIIVAFVLWQNFLEKRLRQSVAAGVVTGRRERLLGVVPFVYPPPLIKVSLFRNFRFSAAMLQMLLFFASFNDFVIYATYFFQDYQGLSPLQTMLRFIPTGVSGVVVAFIVARLLHRVPTVLIAVTGNVAVSIACLLYAVPIPPRTSYFAWGLPSMILAVIGADTTWPSLTLFTSRSLPPQDQAIGGALINASGQLGRAIGLAISTAIQIAVTADARGVSVQDAGSMRPWDDATLKAIRASSWMNMAFGLAALIVAPLVFRGMEIVGKAEPRSAASPRANGDGEEGVLAEPEAQQPEAARQEKS
jgi:MFS family permease